MRSWGGCHRLDPLDLGIKRCEVKDLAGGDAALNASILEDVFSGAQNAVADALNLNAGVALAACEVAGSPAEGVAMAQVCLALQTLSPRACAFARRIVSPYAVGAAAQSCPPKALCIPCCLRFHSLRKFLPASIMRCLKSTYDTSDQGKHWKRRRHRGVARQLVC